MNIKKAFFLVASVMLFQSNFTHAAIKFQKKQTIERHKKGNSTINNVSQSWDNGTHFNGVYSSANTLALDSSGNTFVGGYIDNEYEQQRWCLAKYSPQGERLFLLIEKADSDEESQSTLNGTVQSWSNGDNFQLGEDETYAKIIDLAIDSSGHIWAAGEQYDGSTHKWTLAKYNSDGERLLLLIEKADTGDDDDEPASTIDGEVQEWNNGNNFLEDARINAIETDRSGNIWAAGEQYDGNADRWTLAKYNSDGERLLLLVEKTDTGDDDDEPASTIDGDVQLWNNGNNFFGNAQINTLVIDNLGNVWTGGEQYAGDGEDTNKKWTLIKYNSDGERQMIVIEQTGTGSLRATGNSAPSADNTTWDNGTDFVNNGEIHTLTIDSEGSIWAGGEQDDDNDDGSKDRWTLIKYNSDGERQLIVIEKTGTTSLRATGNSIPSIANAGWDNGDNFDDSSLELYSLSVDSVGNIWAGGYQEDGHDNEGDSRWIMIKYNSVGERQVLLIEKPNLESTVNGLPAGWDNGKNFTGSSKIKSLLLDSDGSILTGGYQHDTKKYRYTLVKYSVANWGVEEYKAHYANAVDRNNKLIKHFLLS